VRDRTLLLESRPLRRLLCLWACAAVVCFGNPAVESPRAARVSPSAGAVAGAEGDIAPRVTKVEPPNWWAGLTPDLMLLVSGEGFLGATVSCSTPGVRITDSKATAGGHYLFVWMTFEDGGPAAGPEKFLVRAANGGETSFELPIAARSSPQGKYQGFSPNDVMYLIMPDRFADGDVTNDKPATIVNRADARAYHGGDLRGIEQHLDYLRDLGVTTIWLTPIVDNTDSTGRDYHGYGAVDEYAVEEHLGTMADLQSLVAAAHKDGLKLILDFVPNHVGPEHPWAALPPESEWFHGTREHHTEATGDFQFVTDPHAPEKYWHNVLDGWFANMLPDLNQDNPDVERYYIQNALWWAESTGIDGYRLDTFPYVPRKFWSDWHAALRRVYPQMTTVGEVFNGEPPIVSFFAGGRAQNDGIDSGVTTVFDYPMFFAEREGVVEKGSVKRVVETLAADHLYPHADELVTIVGNHDVPRLAGMAGITPEQVKLVFSLVLTLRGIPQLYYGDEIGMKGGGDPDNRRDFPGGFPGDTANAFMQMGRTPEQQAIFAHVQKLLALRREHGALRNGELWNLFWDDSAYAFARASGDEKLIVVINAGATVHDLRFSLEQTPVERAAHLVRLFGDEDAKINDGHELVVTMKQRDLAIYAVQDSPALTQ
jgi:glycosidase